MNEETAAPPTDGLEDIPAHFHEVVQKYGKEMYLTVMHAAMATQAAEQLVQLSNKHQSRHGLHATGVLAQAFNYTSNALCVVKGWSPELLAQCDRDCQLAARAAIIPAGSRILLNS